MALSHVFTSPIADFTGTVTVFNSAGATVTANATEIVRPSNWNSVHNEFITISGNTVGASTMSGTNIVLQGGNNVTLSANGASLIFSGPNTVAQSNQPVAFSAGAASSNFSTIVFQDSNGVSFSNNAGSVRLTHDLQFTSATSAITAAAFPSANTTKFAGTGTSKTGAVALTLNSDGLAFNGGSLAGTGFTSTTTAGTAIVATQGTNGLSMGVPAYLTAAAGGGGPAISAAGGSGSTGTIVFSNSNGVSFGWNAGTITATVNPGAAAGIAAIQISNSTYTSGTVNFSNLNGISFGSNGEGVVTASYTVPAATVFSNSNNVSFGLNGSTVTATATFAQTNQSAINAFGVSNTGNTAGNTGVSTGVDWVLAGSGSLTLSQSTAGGGPNTVWFQHPAWITTQTNVAFSADASSTFQTLSFQNSNNVSFSNNAGAIRVTHNLAGTSTGSAGANVGISMTHNSSGLNLSVTTPAETPFGISAGTQSVSTGTLVFSNSNNITFGMSGSSRITASFSTNPETPFGISAGTQSVSTGTLVFSNSNGLTFGMSGSSRVTGSYTVPVVSNGILSVGSATGSGTNTSRFAADDHVHAGVFSMGVSTGGNTSGNTRVDVGQYVLVGGNNITLSQGTAANGLNTITISAGAGGGVNPAASASNGSFAFTTLNFSNANNVTFGTSAGGIITASVAAPGAAAEQNAINLLGANTSGNTTATGSTIGMSGINLTLSGTNASQIVFSAPATSSLVAGANITVSTAGSTISIIGPTVDTALTYQNRPFAASSGTTPGQNSMWVAPMRIALPVSAQTGLMMVSLTGTVTSNQTNTVGATISAALYKYTGGTNSSRLDTYFTQSLGFTFWNSGTASVSYKWDVGQGTSSSGSSAGSNLMTASCYGRQMITFPIGSEIPAGLYAWAFIQSTSSAGNSSVLRTFNHILDNPMAAAQGFIGGATNNSIGYADGGVYSVTTGAFPSSIHLTDVVQQQNRVPVFKMGAL